MGRVIPFSGVPESPAAATLPGQECDEPTRKILEVLKGPAAHYGLKLPIYDIHDLEGVLIGYQISVTKGENTPIGRINVRSSPAYGSVGFEDAKGNEIGSCPIPQIEFLEIMKPFQDFGDHIFRTCMGFSLALDHGRLEL